MKMKISYFVLLMIFVTVLMSACNHEGSSDIKVNSLDGKTIMINSDSGLSEEITDKNANHRSKKLLESSKLFTNKNARYAFAMAVDKEYLQEIVMNNGSVAADYLIPKNFSTDVFGYDFRDRYPEGFLSYDIIKANDYWKTAKEELAFDEVELSLLAYDLEDYRKIAEYLKFVLEKNLEGVKINITYLPMSDKIQKFKRREFDIDLASWSPDYPDPITFLDVWTSTNNLNRSGFKNLEYDNGIFSAKFGELAFDYKKRFSRMQELEKIFLEEAYMVPLLQMGRLWLQRPGIEGLVIAPNSPELTLRYAKVNKKNAEKSINFGIYSEMMGMDSTHLLDLHTASVISNVFEGLMRVSQDFRHVENALAKDFKISENARVYTFYLHENAKWSNGDPVTAHDFVYSWRRLADPKDKSVYSFLLESIGLKNSQKVIAGVLHTEELGIRAIDDHTLEIELEVANPYFLRLLSFPALYPLNHKFVEEIGDDYGTSVENTVFNGPFVVSNWTIGKGYRLKKNQNYYDAKSIQVEDVEFILVKNMEHGIELYESGAIDLIKIAREYASVYADSVDLKFDLVSMMTYFSLNGSGRYKN